MSVFKHRRKVAKDNTVKYNWRTLQLLPGSERRSYAGVVVEVREHLDGTLSVVYQGRVIPTREAPLHKGLLRDGNGNHGQEVSTDWAWLLKRLAALVPGLEEASTAPAADGRQPTPRMRAYWEAVQEAKSRGLSFRAIAKELGIARNTGEGTPTLHNRRSMAGALPSATERGH
jgi:hypothetical protein